MRFFPGVVALAMVAYFSWSSVEALLSSSTQHQRHPRLPSTTELFSSNFANRMSRSGGGSGGRFPGDGDDYMRQQQQEEEAQAPLTWDYNDEDPLSNDDMFAGNNYGTDAPSDISPGEEEEEEEEDTGELPSGEIEGAQLTEDMKFRAKASHNDEKEEASQGGSRFRELMTRARQQASTGVTVQQPPPQYHQQVQQQQQQQRQQPMFDGIPSNFEDLSIDEQARLFRQLMEQRQREQYNAPPISNDPYGQQQQQQQQQQPQQHYPQQNYREYGTGFDGRRIGRNKDTETIANTADAYFAQLKRDSTTRNFARYAGNDQKANDVFHDPSIQDITGPEENPYLLERRERERDLIETVPEEMLLFQEYNDGNNNDRNRHQHPPTRAPSYRDKLAQFQAKKQQLQDQPMQQQQPWSQNQGSGNTFQQQQQQPQYPQPSWQSQSQQPQQQQQQGGWQNQQSSPPQQQQQQQQGGWQPEEPSWQQSQQQSQEQQEPPKWQQPWRPS